MTESMATPSRIVLFIEKVISYITFFRDAKSAAKIFGLKDELFWPFFARVGAWGITLKFIRNIYRGLIFVI